MTLTHYSPEYVAAQIKAREDIIAVRDGELHEARAENERLSHKLCMFQIGGAPEEIQKRNSRIAVLEEAVELKTEALRLQSEANAELQRNIEALNKRNLELAAERDALSTTRRHDPPYWKSVTTTEYVPWSEYSPCAPAPSLTPADNGTPDRCSSAGVSGAGYKAAWDGACRNEHWRRHGWPTKKSFLIVYQGDNFAVKAADGDCEKPHDVTDADRAATDWYRVDDWKAPTL